MKKRILALMMTLVLLACSAPLTGMAAAASYDRPLAKPIGWCIPAGAPEDARPRGMTPSVAAAKPAPTRTVDYLKILGISQATATKFGQRVRDALTRYKTSVDVSDLNIKVDFRYYKNYNAFWCLMDNEMYYHYNTFMFDFGSYTWEHKNYKVTKIIFNSKGFSMPQKEYLHQLDLIRAVIDYLLEDIENNNALSDVQKALIAHDRLANWTEYDTGDFEINSERLPKEAYSAFNLLHYRTGREMAYSEVYAYLLKRMGIKNRMCHSDDLNHIWNIVTIGGKEYYVDVTWDDPGHWNHYGQVKHDYFLVSYNELKKTHQASDYIKITQNSTYDTGWPWEDSVSPFLLMNDTLYYIDNVVDHTEGNYPAALMEWRPGTDTPYKHYDITTDVTWTDNESGCYEGNYTRLDQHNGMLYFNTAKNVWCYNPTTGAADIVFTPTAPANKPNACLHGFTIEWGQFLLNYYDKSPTTFSEIYESRTVHKYKTVSELSIAGLPRVYYTLDETHDVTGLVIHVHYTDGTYEPMTVGYNFSGWENDLYGVHSVSISALGRHTNFQVEVLTADIGKTKVTVKNTHDGLQVNWDPSCNAKGYILYRSYKKNGKWSSWVKLTTTKEITYLNKSVTAGTIYRYGVRPYNGLINGSIHASSGCRRLIAPSISRANVSSGINVSWGKVTKATSYSLYRSTKTASGWSSYTRLTTTSKTTYTDKTAKTGKLYKYAIRANNSSHSSANRISAEIYRLPRVSPTAKKTTGGIRTSWKASSVAEEYVVYRRVNGKTTWTQLAVTTELSYVDTTAKKGTYYQYSVRAKKENSLSGHLASTKVKW